MLLSIEDLSVQAVRDGYPLLRGVSFQINAGDGAALVGESGVGKSILAYAITRLLPEEAARVAAGSVILDGFGDILRLPEPSMRTIRGREIALLPQFSQAALNPTMRVGDQISEALVYQSGLSRRQARSEAVEWMARVRMPRPEQTATQYPHELSGGMQQRVLFAMAACRRPRLLVADEPTSSVDALVQADLLAVIRSLREETGMSLLWITHDLRVAELVADRVLVMYAGEIVEDGAVGALLTHPRHPYTRGLLGAVGRSGSASMGRPIPIVGESAPAEEGTARCAFAPRCAHVMQDCWAKRPGLIHHGRSRIRCFLMESDEREADLEAKSDG